jgi:hypothetical protein
MLLRPVVALKLVSTGWRMLRYHLGAEEYVRRGPPHPFLRLVVAPAAVASTIVLFVTGVVLLALDRTSGTVVGLHKASSSSGSGPSASTCPSGSLAYRVRYGVQLLASLCGSASRRPPLPPSPPLRR